MSNEEDRKSMDDVLASIRRIVRSEKDPEAQTDQFPGGTAAPTTPSPDTAVTDSLATRTPPSQDQAPQPALEPSPSPEPVAKSAPVEPSQAAVSGYEPGREPTLVPSAGLHPAPEAASQATAGPGESSDTTAAPGDAGDAPLALTSDMRLDEAEKAEQSEGSTLAQAMDAAGSDSGAASLAPDGGAVAGLGAAVNAASNAFSGDPEQLKDMVRSVILEELTSSDSAGDAIRSILRDELMSGEIGQNISQNVLALIQAEIAKATGS